MKGLVLFALIYLIPFIIVDIYAQQGKCTTKDEQDWIEFAYSIFPESMNICATESLTIDSIATKCLTERLKASPGCIECAVGVYNCIAQYCINDCVTVEAAQGYNYFSAKCLRCLKGSNQSQHNCVKDASDCSGWTEDFIFNCETCKTPLKSDIFPGIDDVIIWSIIGGIGGLILICLIASCIWCKKHEKNKHIGDNTLPPLKPSNLIQQQTSQTRSGFFQMLPGIYPFHHTHAQQPTGLLAPPPGLDNPNTSMESNTQLDMNGKLSFTGILDGNSAESMNSIPREPYMMQSVQISDRPMNAGVQTPTPLVVTYDFEGKEEDELKVKRGTVLEGIELIGEWWRCIDKSSNKIGMIPSTYVDLLKV